MPSYKLIFKPLSESNEKIITTMQLHAEKSLKYRNVLLAKADEYTKQPRNIPNLVEFELILKKLDELFEMLETLLRSHPHKWFLSDTITVLDICFGILLYRLDMLGLDKKLWVKRPKITEYFKGIQELPSFQKSVPSHFSNARAMWSKLPDQYKFGSVGLISASSLGLLSILKKVG